MRCSVVRRSAISSTFCGLTLRVGPDHRRMRRHRLLGRYRPQLTFADALINAAGFAAEPPGNSSGCGAALDYLIQDRVRFALTRLRHIDAKLRTSFVRIVERCQARW